jgi:tetratricopeptide (TPR) repeat protein
VHWYRWYRSEVPRDREQLEAARAAHLQDPADAEARSVLGRAAYDADQYARAADQYEAILARHPHDPSARLRLARVAMRRGHHTKEIQHYRVLLSRNAFDVAARSGLAVALTRLERLDEAAEHLEELRLEHPAHPLTLLTEAKTLALAGRDAEVLEAIDDLMRARGTLSAEWRLEIRRDIALDPAFARLRKNVRLRGVMNRHLGAAGPRPMR